MVLHDDQLEQVASLMEELATALRRMKVGTGEVPPTGAESPPAPPPTAPRDDTIYEGSHVKVIRALDRYRGRTGTVVSRRGTQYWNVRLDIQGKETIGPLIYKKDASLQVVL